MPDPVRLAEWFPARQRAFATSLLNSGPSVANNFTPVSDRVKKDWVGSTTGLAGFAGAVGGFLITGVVSTWLITVFGYAPVFILMGCLHPLAGVCLYLLVKPSQETQEA